MVSGRHGRPQTKRTLEDPIDFMGTLQETAYVIREQVVVARQMMNQLGRQLEGVHEGNPNGPEIDLEYLKFVEF